MIPATYPNHFQSRTRSGNRLFRAGMFSSRMISIVLLALLALLYIAQSTQGATNEVKYQRLRSQADATAQQNDQLELDAERLQSLSNLDKSAPALGLEPATVETYLTPAPTYQTAAPR